MSLAPAVGIVLGVAVATAGLGLRALGAPLLLAAVGAVAIAAILTRGLHLDGLADTGQMASALMPTGRRRWPSCDGPTSVRSAS